jgi:hypothetical protein
LLDVIGNTIPKNILGNQKEQNVLIRDTRDVIIRSINIFIGMKILITEQQLNNLLNSLGHNDSNEELIYEDIYGSVEETDYIADFLNEAEYQGRKVQLGKIMQGDIKKFKVYVKNDKGKVVKVNFGFGGKSAKGKIMRIKKNNPARRKSFRARHNCDTPGPRWKPRYWACRTW